MEKTNDYEDVFFNTIKFVNDPELWKERKLIMEGWIEEDLKKKEFITKHLSENFKNLFPSKEVQDFMSNTNLYCHYSNSSGEFFLRFHFTPYKYQPEELFEFKVKIKDIETSPKIINKKELKDIFQKILFCVGYQIGFMQSYIERIDIEIAVINNDRETIKVKESIFDVQKIFFDYVCKIIKDQNHLYNYLFPFFSYFSNLNDSISEREFSRFIADITENKIDSETIRQTFINHRKDNKIPKLW